MYTDFTFLTNHSNFTTMKNLFSCFTLLLAFFASSFTLPESASTQNSRPVAAFDAFLKIDGIQGESRDDKHKGWIEIESHSLNATGKTLNIVRPKTATSSPKLAAACAKGQHFKKAILHVRKSGGDGTYMKYELENVLISSYSVSGASSSRPMESLSLNFTKIEY